MASAKKIPQLSKLPIVGNLHHMTTSQPVGSFIRMAKEFDGIFKLEVFDNHFVAASSYKYVNELCDESRFEKTLSKPLQVLRSGVKDGLFSAYNDEPNWGKASRILMPVFGKTALRDMFEPMLDIAEQLLLKWERLPRDHKIDLTADTTRLTLDTIALATMNYRINSFYDVKMHPFVDAMIGALGYSLNPNPISLNLPHNKLNYQKNKKYLHDFVDRLIKDRQQNLRHGNNPDLLDLMLNARDPVTGEKLDLENIRYQLITFLIAGHETTSGMLSFTIYELLNNPEALQRAKSEVDTVLGNRMPGYEDLAKFPYIEACFKESLRLWPTAPAFAVTPIRDEEVLAGEYTVYKGKPILILAPCLHRDPEIWKQPERFMPERMLPENFSKIPPNAWRPFGNGKRACIGRAFAMQESILFLSMLLQRFDLALADSNYSLKIKEMLTIKPENLFIKATRNKMRLVTQDQVSLNATEGSFTDQHEKLDRHLFVAYGSNMGTGEAFARQIADEMKAHYQQVTLCTLNEFLDHITNARYAVIICSSYEGKPPHNAEIFVDKLTSDEAFKELDQLNFTIFGCGDKNWSATYQKVPKAIQKSLSNAGAKEIIDFGAADAAGDPFQDFDNWFKRASLQLSEQKSTPNVHADSRSLSIDLKGNFKDHLFLRYNLQRVRIIEKRPLVDMSKEGARKKIHIELAWDNTKKYEPGDYLAVLPENSASQVNRALDYFGIDGDLICHIKGDSCSSFIPPHLPKDRDISARQLLGYCVDLNQPMRQSTFELLSEKSMCPPHKKRFETLATDEAAYRKEILDRNLNLIDFLKSESSIILSFEEALQQFSPIQPRIYSISSSPNYSPESCSITVSVLEAPHFSGSGIYQGLCSHYIDSSAAGNFLPVGLKKAHKGFCMPTDPQTPLILIGAGSGIAPLRSFWQERCYQKEKGLDAGGAYLFFGCDHDQIDYLYKSEIREFQNNGHLQAFPAFSRGENPQFVQDVIWEQRDLFWLLISKGAKVFICGDGKYMAPAVRETIMKIYQENNPTKDQQQTAEKWLALKEESSMIVFDIFS